jgi:hypothetical protein
MENGEWRMGNGGWGMGNGELRILFELLDYFITIIFRHSTYCPALNR